MLRRISMGLLLLAAIGLGLASVGIPSGQAQNKAAIPDYRYLLLQPERAAAELERVGQGALRAMSRREFESLYSRAREVESGRAQPQLLVSTYRARLENDNLVGEARWTIRKSERDADLLSLEPMSAAIRSAKWSDGRTAQIGCFSPAGGTQLLMDQAGDQSLTADWSARGLAEPNGCRFDVRFPHCAIATLELELPADRELRITGAGTILSGPTQGTDSPRRIWRVAFAGDNLGELRVAPAAATDALVLATVETQQEIQPAQTQCEFRFNLDVVKGPLRNLTLDCSPGFIATEIIVRNLARWTTTPGPAPQCTIEWNEPFSGGSLVVRGFVVHRGQVEWTSPVVAPIGSVVSSERLTILAGPATRLENVRLGAFHLSGGTTSSERGQIIAANSGPIQSGSGRVRARIFPIRETIRQHERTWWDDDDDRSRAIAQLTVEPRWGVANRSTWVLPPGWTVSSVESSPHDLLASWRIQTDADFGPTLKVEWARAIQAGRPATVSIRLEQSQLINGSRRIWPNLRPIVPTTRTGILAVRAPRGMRLEPIAGSERDLKPDDRAAMPGEVHSPDAVLPLEIMENRSTIEFEPAEARIAASVSCQVELAASEAHWTTRLVFDAGDRAVNEIVLSQCDQRMMGFTWEDARTQSKVATSEYPLPGVISMAAAAGSGPWQALAEMADRPTHTLILRLPQPAVGRVLLIGRGVLPLSASPADNAPIPAFQVAGTRDTPWTMSIDHRAAPMWSGRTTRGTTAWPEPESVGIQRFRLSGGSDAVSIVPAMSPRLLDPRLEISTADRRRALFRLQVDVLNWNRRTLPVQLPAGAELISAAIDGHAVVGPLVESSQNGAGVIPVPAPPSDFWKLELKYSVAKSTNWIIDRLPIRMPVLPELNERTSIRWFANSGWAPLSADWRAVGSESGAWDYHAAIRGGNSLDDYTSFTIVNMSAGSVIAYSTSAIWLLAGLCGLSWVRSTSIALCVALAVILSCWHSPVNQLLIAPLVVSLAAALTPAVPGIALPRVWRLRRLRPSSVLAMIGVIWLGGLGVGSPPPAVLIPVVPDPAGHSERDTVLAPRELDQQLRDTIRSRQPAMAGTVVDARFEGQADDKIAHFTARVEVFCPGESTDFAIPFVGSALRGITVDGSPGLPRTEREVIVVPMRGKGIHELQFSFSTPIQHGELASLRIPISESARCRLTFQAPKDARHVQALSCRGQQRALSDSDRQRIEADLGPVKSIYLRWLPAGNVEPSSFQCSEAYLWDISDSGARLFGELACRLERPAQSIDIELPAGVEVHSVLGEPTERSDPAEVMPWLARWETQSDGAARRLHLEFSSPIRGLWAIRFECRPTAPLTSIGSLLFPSVEGARAPSALCAWRAEGVAVTVNPSADFVASTPDALARTAPQSSRWETSVRPPAMVYSRLRPDITAPLRIRAASIRPKAEVAMIWTVDTANSTGEWSGRFRSSGDRLTLLEWDLPTNVTVKEVRGDDVGLWNRSGSRLQVWLKKPVAETAIAWVGSAPRTRDGKFDLPLVRLLRASETSTVQVVAHAGLTLSPVDIQRFEAAKGSGLGGRLWEFRPIGANPRAQFQVRDALGSTDFELRTVIDRVNAEFQATTTIEARIRRGTLRTLMLRADNTTDATFEISAPGATVTESSQRQGLRNWFVDFQQEMRGTVQIHVRTVAPAQPGRRWTAPNLTVAVESSRRCKVRQSLSLVENHVSVAETIGLSEENGVWRAGTGPWRMTIAEAADIAPTKQPRIRIAELGVALENDQLTYALTAQVQSAPRMPLALKWPAPVEILLVQFDGAPQRNGSGLTDRWVLPDGPNKAATVRLVWRTPSAGRLDFVPPGFETATGPCPAEEMLLTLALPPDQTATVSGTPIQRADAAARRHAAGLATAPGTLPAGIPFASRFEGEMTQTWVIDGSAALSPDSITFSTPGSNLRWWRVAGILSFSTLAWLAGWFGSNSPRWLTGGVLAGCGWLATGNLIWLVAVAICACVGLTLAVRSRWHRARIAAA